MLDDGVALVAGDHADVKEAAVFGVAHRLEGILRLIAIVLRRLHDRDLGICKSGNQIGQPSGFHFVVAVDHGNDLGSRVRPCECIVQCAGFESGQRADMKEAESRSERATVRFDRTPRGLIRGVVVDDERFVVLVLELCQGIERLDEHVGRLVVRRHMNRDSRCITRVRLMQAVQQRPFARTCA